MKRATMGWLVALFFSTAAHAIPVSYNINFDVEFISDAIPSDPDVRVGNRYLGSFIVDDSLLLHDGLNQLGTLSAFRVQFEDVIWDMNDPARFGGFRGPNGLFSPSPGFDVLGGELVNLRGGMFSGADFPFIDFSFDLRLLDPEPSACTGQFCGNKAGAFSSASQAGGIVGTMSLLRVSEPSLPAWMLAAVVATLFWSRRAGWLSLSRSHGK